MAVAAKLDKNRELRPQDKLTEVVDRKKGLTKREVESCLQKSGNQVRRGDRLCQMKSTPTPSPDSSRHHLCPAGKRECISDSGTLHIRNSSPSLNQLRSRTAKRPTLFTKSIKSNCCTGNHLGRMNLEDTNCRLDHSDYEHVLLYRTNILL